jgi:uncharacterized delta-60 repeat protein
VPSDATLLANGDIVVSGSFGLARFASNGALDQSFGASGFAATGFNEMGLGPSGLAIQPDGKIVWVGANTTQVTGGIITDFAVERFTANGSPDTSFGSGGMVTTEFFAPPAVGALELADAALIQPDNKILVGGSATQGQNKFAPQQTALARYNPDGSLDSSFGSGGKTLRSPGGARTIGLDAAGNIFVLPAEAEFSPTGQADPAVTPAPITTSSQGGPDVFLSSGQSLQGRSVGVVKHDTDAQVGGAHFLATSVFGLARLTTNGNLDPTFGNGGMLTTFLQGNEGVAALLIQPDGKIVAVGYSENNATGVVDVALVRYLGG